MSRATEDCVCGSTFTYVGDDDAIASQFANWRTDHRHEMPGTAPPASPTSDTAELNAVTGTHHQAGAVRPDPIGRRRAVGFQLQPTPEKEIPHV